MGQKGEYLVIREIKDVESPVMHHASNDHHHQEIFPVSATRFYMAVF